MSEYEFWDELGNIFKAVVTYQQKTIEFNKRFVNPWIRLGTVFDRQDHIADSMGAYKKAIEIDPENAANWSALGDVYFKTGSFEDAVTAYTRAIELNPREGWAHANLALTYATRQKYTEAVNLYIKSLELITDEKDRAMIWNRLGNVYRRVNDYENAMIAFQMADECDDENTGFTDKLDEVTVEQTIVPVEAGEGAEPETAVISLQEEAELPTEIAATDITTPSGEVEAVEQQAVVAENPNSEEPDPGDNVHTSSIEDYVPMELVEESEPLQLNPEGESNLEISAYIAEGELPSQEEDSDMDAESQEEAQAVSEEAFSGESVPGSLKQVDSVVEIPVTVNNEEDARDEQVNETTAMDETSIDAPSTETIVTSDLAGAVETFTDLPEVNQPVFVVGDESEMHPAQVDVVIGNEVVAGEQDVVPQLTFSEDSVTEDPGSETEGQSEVQDEGIEFVEPVAEVEVQADVISPETSPAVEIEPDVDNTMTQEGTGSESEMESSEQEFETPAFAEGQPEAEVELTSLNEADVQSNELIIHEILSLADGEPTREAAYEEFLKDALSPALEATNEQVPDQVVVEQTPVPAENHEFNIEPDTNNAHVWNELGNVYFNTGAYEGAIAAYSKAIDLDGWFAWPYSNLALAYVQKEKYGEAVSLYQRSIELFTSDKDKAITWNRLGNVYRRMNDYENAIASYQRADELDPNNATRSLRSRFSLLGSLNMDQSPSLVF